jgi:hypothetical protein
MNAAAAQPEPWGMELGMWPTDGLVNSPEGRAQRRKDVLEDSKNGAYLVYITPVIRPIEDLNP